MEHGSRRGILSKRPFFAPSSFKSTWTISKESQTGRPERRGSPGREVLGSPLFDYCFATGG